jgi:ribosomal protein L24E
VGWANGGVGGADATPCLAPPRGNRVTGRRAFRLGSLGILAILAAFVGLALPAAAPATAAPAAAPATVHPATASPGGGYWEVASDGGVFTFGDAGYFGSTGGMSLNQPIVGMAPAPDGRGYWLVASDGGVFTFGDAGYFGSTGGMPLNQPIVGLAPTPDGQGYWLVASDGGIFTFGDARFFGSTGGMPLNQPIVGLAPTPDGRGYWLVASDGGIFTFGDAAFLGSTGSLALNRPIVGLAPTSDGQGYWLVASDGGIFTFGDAAYLGSAPSMGSDVGNVVAMAAAGNGQGYWITGSNGGITFFGDASSDGTTAGTRLNKPIVGFAAAPQGIPEAESPAPVTIATTALTGANLGVPYTASLAVTGGTAPYAWTISAGALPLGLSLSSAGVITGTPTALGGSSFTVRVNDAARPTALTTTATYSVAVTLAPVSITTSSVRNGTLGAPYSATVGAAGGTAPYHFTLAGGALPAGLSLSPGGVISGVPSVQGTSSFTVLVTDGTTPTPMAATEALAISVFPTTAGTSSVLSSNWSGYVELNGPFTAVTGTFSVPSLVAGVPQSDQASEWVGIDGGNGDNSLIQAGVNESPDPNNPGDFLIQPWWEILPAAETFISTVQVRAGDQVTISIGQLNGSQWAITLTDVTDGQSFTTDQTYTGPAATAEWIVEALTVNGQVAMLAPYAPVVDFTNLRFSGTNTRLQEVIMVQGNNQVSTPSALTPNGFEVAYGSVAPAAP